MTVIGILAVICGVMAAIGVAYQLFGMWALPRFIGRLKPRATGIEGVTLLKPLYGAEPRLFENLSSFLCQDYPGPVQMVCGLGSDDDPAAAVVRALQAAHPQMTIDLVIHPSRHGSNAKISNLINMMGAVRHDLLVMLDSDIAAPPEYLSLVLGALEQPGVGAVSCLFHGRGDTGVWSQLSAAMISYGFMLNMVISRVTKLAKPCVGATIALRRKTLTALGGFARFNAVLADDYALGEAVRELGLKVHIPPLLLPHGCDERSLGAVWRHHLRWAATVRDIALPGHLGSATTHPLGFSLLLTLLDPWAGLLLCLATLCARFALVHVFNRRIGHAAAPLWLVPFADILSFAVFIASLFAKKIEWRGASLIIGKQGHISEAALTTPSPK